MKKLLENINNIKWENENLILSDFIDFYLQWIN